MVPNAKVLVAENAWFHEQRLSKLVPKAVVKKIVLQQVVSAPPLFFCYLYSDTCIIFAYFLFTHPVELVPVLRNIRLCALLAKE